MAALQGGGAVSYARGTPAASKSLSPKVSGNISLGIAKFLEITNFLGIGINRAALEREAEVGALVVEGVHLPLLPRHHNLRFRGGLVFKADRLVYHSTLGSRVIKKKKEGLRFAKSQQPPGWVLDTH